MNIYNIEKIVHEFDSGILIEMIVEYKKVSCITNYENIRHEFHIELDSLKEMVRLLPQDISKFVGENIIMTYKADINYLRMKKLERLI